MHFTKKNALNHFFLLNFYMHFSLNIFRTKCINYNTCIIVPCFDYLIFSYKSQKELLTGILKNAYPKKYRICCLQNAYWLFPAKSWKKTFHLLIRYWWNATKAHKILKEDESIMKNQERKVPQFFFSGKIRRSFLTHQ